MNIIILLVALMCNRGGDYPPTFYESYYPPEYHGRQGGELFPIDGINPIARFCSREFSYDSDITNG